VHLIGFIIRIYHDARSSECQIRAITTVTETVKSVRKYKKCGLVSFAKRLLA